MKSPMVEIKVQLDEENFQYMTPEKARALWLELNNIFGETLTPRPWGLASGRDMGVTYGGSCVSGSHKHYRPDGTEMSCAQFVLEASNGEE